jgi:hypothetical protein
MGYRGKLLAMNRLESYGFAVGSPDAATTLQELRRLLATQTLFFNRNKHNYFLDCRWDGQTHSEGTPVAVLESLALQAARWAKLDESQDLDGQRDPARVILQRDPIYRAEVVVEDIDPTASDSLARRLESELSSAAVSVSELGIRWYLALDVPSGEEAEDVTQGIVVAERRNRGLLLNPNYQRYKLLSLNQIGLDQT